MSYRIKTVLVDDDGQPDTLYDTPADEWYRLSVRTYRHRNEAEDALQLIGWENPEWVDRFEIVRDIDPLLRAGLDSGRVVIINMGGGE